MELKNLWTSLTNRGDQPGVVLEIDLARGVVSAPPEHPLAALRALNSTTLAALRKGLRQAATDDRVLGLIVHIAPSGLGLAELDELGQAIADFTGHKPSIAWAQTFGELSNGLPLYALASRAGQVWLQPTGELNLAGAQLDITLLRGLLDKAGVEPQFGQRKEYKTAADQFAATSITAANREMMQRIADSVVESLVDTICRARSLTPERVREAMAESPLTPERALELGLVTSIGYRDEVYAHALQTWQASADQLSFVARYQAKADRAEKARQFTERKAPVIGVVNLRGAIVTGRGTPAGLGQQPQAAGDVIEQQLRAALREDRVKAVVLRIDSPGGSAVASDVIWRAVGRVRASGRPVVAVMGSVAASGGYYSAMGANEIWAQPTTLTGSIGVLAGKLVTQGLMDKLGIIRESVQSGPRAGFMATSSGFSEEDWQLLDRWLDRIYEDFTTKAAQGRGMDLDQLQAVAKGRVWTGADALERGLIDGLGGTDQAIDRACALAGVSRSRAVVRPLGHQGLLDRFRPAENSESAGLSTAAVPTGPDALLARAVTALGWQAMLPIHGPLALPWHIDLS